MRIAVAVGLMVMLVWGTPSIEKYEILLDFAVCESGVNYEKIRGTAHIGEVEQEFREVGEDTFENWSEPNQIAWLINLYNFYTIKLITENYPVESIKDIRSPWDQNIVPLWGEQISLNDIEHEMLRRNYDEPQIHFALVCASVGCPSLMMIPFAGDHLSDQLDQQASLFLGDRTKNYRDGSTIYLSKIFQWYGDDFNNRFGNYQNYVKTVLNIDERVRVRFLSYDWNLNATECE